MRKTLIALMFAAALPTVAMAMPGGDGQMGPRHGGEHHGRGDAPYSQLDLTREQRQQIGKLMGEQMHDRKQLVDRFEIITRSAKINAQINARELAVVAGRTDQLPQRRRIRPEHQRREQ